MVEFVTAIATVNFFTEIKNAISQIINFFKALFKILEITIQLIPKDPFLNITILFTPILIAAIIYKVIR